jgi:hypothetical protein
MTIAGGVQGLERSQMVKLFRQKKLSTPDLLSSQKEEENNVACTIEWGRFLILTKKIVRILHVGFGVIFCSI